VDDIALVPLEVIAQPLATTTIELEFMFQTMNDGTNHATVNQITYNSPLVPAVFSALSLGSNATTAEAYGPLSFVVNHLDVVDIVIKNADTGKHPLYAFYH
jgi:iron transport multicopper oxidase